MSGARNRSVRRLAVLAALVLCPAFAAQAQWAYRTGELREAQQANFCASEADVEEIAAVFERYGARTGFSALSASESCVLESRTFTPLQVVREVRITLASGDTYSVRFIRVELVDGSPRFMVTTRELDP